MALEMLKTGDADRQWQSAGDRMLLYLRCLGFSAPHALEFTLKAMKEAELSLRRNTGNSPLSESMRVLRRLLGEQGIEAQEPEGFFLDSWCEHPVHSLPPLHHIPMVSEKVVFAQRHSLFKGILRRLRRPKS